MEEGGICWNCGVCKGKARPPLRGPPKPLRGPPGTSQTAPGAFPNCSGGVRGPPGASQTAPGASGGLPNRSGASFPPKPEFYSRKRPPGSIFA